MFDAGDQHLLPDPTGGSHQTSNDAERHDCVRSRSDIGHDA